MAVNDENNVNELENDNEINEAQKDEVKLSKNAQNRAQRAIGKRIVARRKMNQRISRRIVHEQQEQSNAEQTDAKTVTDSTPVSSEETKEIKNEERVNTAADNNIIKEEVDRPSEQNIGGQNH